MDGARVVLSHFLIADYYGINPSDYTSVGQFTVASNPSPSDTLTIYGSANGIITLTMVAGSPTAGQVVIGGDANETATNLAAAISAIAGAEFNAVADGAIVSISAVLPEELYFVFSGAWGTVDSIINPDFPSKSVTSIVNVSSTFDALIANISSNISVASNISTLSSEADETICAHFTLDDLMPDIAASSHVNSSFESAIDGMTTGVKVLSEMAGTFPTEKAMDASISVLSEMTLIQVGEMNASVSVCSDAIVVNSKYRLITNTNQGIT